MNRLVLVLVLLSMMSCASDPHPDYDRLQRSGLRYKILSFDEEGISPQQGDMVRFKIQMYAGDTLWWKTSQPQVIRYDTTSSGLRSDLQVFRAGDSLSVLMEPEELWSEFGFLDDTGRGITDVHLRILDVIPFEKWAVASEMDRELKQQREVDLMQSFLDTCVYASQFTMVDGMYWRTLSSGDEVSFPFGTELMVHYKGMLMDGTVIDDRTGSADGLSYSVGMQGQLIPGLVQAVRSMSRGERVELIIPSNLAFGEDGSAGGIVPPWTPVRFVLWVNEGC
jgi:hypothetical protein